MSEPATNLNTARAGFLGLVVVLLLVVLIRSPSDAPGPMNAAGSVAPTPAESGETPLEPPVEPSVEPSMEPVRTGCFRSGSSRNEVRTAMGAPDAINRGFWEYGQDWVTFGYGVVLDFSNEGGNLRLCDGGQGR
jgi:hypothetical protein